MLKVVLVGIMLTLTAGLGMVGWVSLYPAPVVVEAEAAPPLPARLTVLAAARAVQAGSLLKPEDIGTIDLPAVQVPEGARADTAALRAELVGAMARHALLAQQPLLPADILRPSEGGFLAAVLAPNHRAVSVAVDAVSGTAGLIWPGDRVDVILTQTLDNQATPAGRRTFGETVLRNLRVIAVDQLLARGTAPDTATSPPANRTVTLEVSPEAAEGVAVAVRLGKVALTVRAADSAQSTSLTVPVSRTGLLHDIKQAPRPPGEQQTLAAAPKAVPTTWGQDVSPGLNQVQHTPGAATVRVFQGAANEKEFKFE